MRYDERQIILNNSPLYKEKLRKTGKRAITQYATAPLRNPTQEEAKNLMVETHVWKQGDRFYKLADRYYGDSKLWWVIAQYNMTPTEAYVGLGSQVYIPLPLNRILEYYGL
jgi:nucleoid-associated protein YgaU